MNDGGFVAFFLLTMLNDHFHTKSGMARTLGLHLRTVQTAFRNIKNQKGASLVFIYAICYCYNHGISVDAIHEKYTTKKNADSDDSSNPFFAVRKPPQKIEPLSCRQRFCSLYKIFRIPSLAGFA